jgi:hypothetical protein
MDHPMLLPRRSFLRAGLGLLVAPAVVKAKWLMPIRPLTWLRRTQGIVHTEILSGGLIGGAFAALYDTAGNEVAFTGCRQQAVDLTVTRLEPVGARLDLANVTFESVGAWDDIAGFALVGAGGNVVFAQDFAEPVSCANGGMLTVVNPREGLLRLT